MAEGKIGWRCRRLRTLRDGTRKVVGKWHLIDSIVADRYVTRCGKELKSKNAAGVLEFIDGTPLTRMIGQPQLCSAGCPQS